MNTYISAFYREGLGENRMTQACKQIREDILSVANASRQGHIPTCFSVVEILWAVYDVMNHDPRDPGLETRDIFILSKGHASLAYYCVLARLGYFNQDDVRSFGSFMSPFGCHVDRHKVPGVEISTGSLGHGIGIAVGTALACKMKRSPRRVLTLIGDGEANEGSVWEAVMVATRLGLDNLTVVYDDNRSHSRGLQILNPVERFRSFGCETIEAEGHDVGALRDALLRPASNVKAVVAQTVKGYGCATLEENAYEWHRRSPNEGEFARLMEELNEKAV